MRNQFTTIPNEFINNSASISAKTKWIYVVLKSYSDSEGKCFPSYDELQNKTGFRRPAIAQGLLELEEKGWITKVKIAGKRGVIYTVFNSPTSDTNSVFNSSTDATLSINTTILDNTKEQYYLETGIPKLQEVPFPVNDSNSPSLKTQFSQMVEFKGGSRSSAYSILAKLTSEYGSEPVDDAISKCIRNDVDQPIGYLKKVLQELFDKPDRYKAIFSHVRSWRQAFQNFAESLGMDRYSAQLALSGFQHPEKVNAAILYTIVNCKQENPIEFLRASYQNNKAWLDCGKYFA